jgi:hypothetical protein
MGTGADFSAANGHTDALCRAELASALCAGISLLPAVLSLTASIRELCAGDAADCNAALNRARFARALRLNCLLDSIAKLHLHSANRRFGYDHRGRCEAKLTALARQPARS